MKKVFIILYALFFFVSCNNSSTQKMTGLFSVTPPDPLECSAENKMQFVYDLMHDSYFWADEMPDLNQSKIYAYGNEVRLLNALRHDKDRFSFIMDATSQEDYFEKGETKSFGFLYIDGYDENNKFDYLGVSYVYPNSPMHAAGMKRGDHIVGVDGFDILTIRQSNMLIDRYFGDGSVDLTATFDLGDRNITVSRESFEIKTVSHYDIIDVDEKKVGYLHFKTFVATSNDALDSTFAYFKAQGIDELILDLRYNGGGYVYVANHLATLIGGKYVSGKVLERTIFNAKYRAFDNVTYFEQRPEQALDLKRVFIIADNSSASASEVVINGLKAVDNSVEVIQIGTPTKGKPYGMLGGKYCSSYIFPVQIKGVNADGFGDYETGLVPTCRSANNMNFAIGDINESSLSDTLYYIKNGNCKEKYIRSRVAVERKQEPISQGFRALHGIY